MILQAVQIAGTILATFVILSLLVIVHELGHFVTARAVGIRVLEFGVGFPPRAKVLGRDHETDYTINWLPIGGFVKLEGEDADSDDPRAFSNAGLPKQLFVLVAGVTMNLVTAFLLFFLAVWMFNPTVGFQITRVSAGSPAAGVGLQEGQTIESVNGQRYGFLSAENASQTLRSHAGKPVQLGIIDKDGTHHTVTVTLADQAAIDANKGALGVGLGERALGGVITSDPISAIPAAANETTTALSAILVGLRDLGAGIVTNPTQAPSGVGGPIEITRQVGFALWDLGPVFLIIMAALLSANLALINVLPFPPLDGGRMAVLVVKRLFGSRGVSRLEATTYLVGFALLMAFILWISFFDITNPARQ